MFRVNADTFEPWSVCTFVTNWPKYTWSYCLCRS
jgi:hypothetical protein